MVFFYMFGCTTDWYLKVYGYYTLHILELLAL